MMVLRAFWGSPRAELGRQKGHIWSYLFADQSSTNVFWSLFLCFLFFLLDMLMFFLFFFLFCCFLVFFVTYVYVLVFFLFFPLGGYLCRFWTYKLPLQQSQIMVLLWKSLHVWNIKVLYWKTGLGAFLRSFLAHFGWSVSYWKTGLGAFWCLFDFFWVVLGVWWGFENF